MKRRQQSVHPFLFASLQGKSANRLIGRYAKPPFESVVFFDQGQIYIKSTAIILVLSELGGAWKLFKVFLLVPKILRDFFYDRVASLRYVIFGKRHTCRLPTAEERLFFIQEDE
jgi:predicted DCC family thiol-disulfide oxidoreductase YuxK